MRLRITKVLSLSLVIFGVLSNLASRPALTGAETGLQPLAAGADGFALAWIVMAILVAALLYALVGAILLALGREVPAAPGGTSVVMPVVALVGLGVALYLTYVETQDVAAVCGPVGDCNAVQASPFATLFGVLPVGLLGALGYVGILAAWAAGRFGSFSLARVAGPAMLGMALFGVIFSIYLTYLELFIIKAVCIWCLTSAVLIALVLVLAVGPAAAALVDGDEE
jgi:uncharacterized membrane protein